MLVALLLAAALFLYQARNQMVRTARSEVQADIASLTRITAMDSVVGAIEILEERAARTQQGGLVYIVLDPENGTIIAGNIARWPADFPLPIAGRIGSSDVRLSHGDGEAMVGQGVLLDGHFPLFTGRRIEGFAVVRTQTFQMVGLLALLLLAVDLVLALLTIRQSSRRIAYIDTVLVAFTQGARAIRIADGNRDALGMVSARIDGLLDLVGDRLRSHELIAEQIAHELRGPVARSAAQMREGSFDSDADSLLARAAMDDLLRMIDAILFITDMRTRELMREPVALDRIVAAVATLYADVAEYKDIALLLDLHAAPVLGEAALLERLVVNLVDNGFKYSPPGTAITVRTWVDGAGAVLEICDKGEGLAGFPDTPGLMLARGRTACRVEGTGMGLALVLRIAERHDADIQFADRPGGGLRALVRFPPLSTVTSPPPSTKLSAAQ